MKTILVPVERHDQLASVFETAYQMAMLRGAYVEGFAPQPEPPHVTVDPLGGAIMHVSDLNDTEEIAEARKAFEGYMRDKDLPLHDPAAASVGPSFAWRERSEPGGDTAGELGRVFDMSVVGRPGSGASSPRMSALETVLFETGRPVLVAPPVPPRSIGRTIVISWNRSPEAARATVYAMPLLKSAGRIIVLTTEGGLVPGPSGEQAALYLHRNGIEAEAIHVESGDRSAGEAILAESVRLGCDLLVKGAYTQSRLRQMFFGGQTSYLLANATIPMLLSH